VNAGPAQQAVPAAAGAPPPAAKPRVLEYDVARCLALLTLHVTGIAHLRAPQLGWPWVLNRALIDYAAPMLLVVAGALSWTPARLRGARSYGRYLLARGWRVLPAYLVFSAVFWAYSLWLGGALKTAWAYLELLVTGLTFYHLWFVPTVIVVYLVAPLGAAVVKRHPLLVLVLVYAVSFAVVKALDVSHLSWLDSRMQRSILTTFRYLPYAAWGAVYAWSGTVRRNMRRWWPGIVAGGVALGYGLSRLQLDSTVMVSLKTMRAGMVCLAVLGMCAAISEAWPKVAAAARAAAPLTYVIYLVHALFLALIDHLLTTTASEAFIGQTWFVLAVYLAILLPSAAVAWVWVLGEKALSAKRSAG
jgi:surface polysaccharide O-acyltransferase-like enzyme